MYKVPAQLVCLERSSQNILYREWLMTCGHYCRISFPRSLWSKTLISVWVLFLMVMELWWIFNCCICLPVNFTSQLTLRPSASRNRNSQHKLQLATCTVHNPVAAWAVADGCIFDDLLQTRVYVNWRQFLEAKLNLYFNLWDICLFIILFHLFQEFLPSVLSFKWP
jgi:hypothetical protein